MLLPKFLFPGTATGTATLVLPAGVYVVRAGPMALRLAVE